MIRRDGAGSRRTHPLAPAAGLIAAGAAVLALSGVSDAAVSSVTGGAFGEQVDITITGIGNLADGPRPSVTLPSTGGSATQSLAAVSIGPGGLFLTSGALGASSEGTTGANGAVTSSAMVTTPNVLQTLEAASVASTCTASESGLSGSTAVVEGTLLQTGTTSIPLPANPPPNTSFDGTNADTGDQFTVVLNQQATSGGVLTVNAVNFILRGPTATGNVILAQSRCGVAATAASTTTTTTGGTTPTTSGTAPTTSGGTTSVSGDSLARTGPASALQPVLAVGLLVGAVTASRWARRRPSPR